MRALYVVTAVKNPEVTEPSEYQEGGYIHKFYQVASSKKEAIELAKTYMPIGTEYDSMTASYVRSK